MLLPYKAFLLFLLDTYHLVQHKRELESASSSFLALCQPQRQLLIPSGSQFPHLTNGINTSQPPPGFWPPISQLLQMLLRMEHAWPADYHGSLPCGKVTFPYKESASIQVMYMSHCFSKVII